MAVALKLFLLASSAAVVFTYPLCESEKSKYCNGTRQIIYSNALFVWNKGASSMQTSAATAHGIILVFLMLMSVLGNGALIVTTVVEKRFRTPTNHLVVSQCASDLCMTLIVQSMTIIALFNRAWECSPLWCMVQVALLRIFLLVTFFHIVLLTINRYIVIVKSRRKDRFTQNEVSFASGMVWLLAILLGMPWEVASLPISTWYEVTTTFCIWRPINFEDRRICILTMARIILLVITGLIIIFCFYHILSALRTNRRKVSPSTISNWRKIAIAVYAKSAYTCLAVLCSFCICLMPFLIVTVLTFMGKSLSYEAFATSIAIIFANAAIKPVIYITRSVAWSRKLRRIFKRRRRSKRRTADSPSPKRISRYIVDKNKSNGLSMSIKVPANRLAKTQDFYEMFCIGRTTQAWETGGIRSNRF